MMTIDCRQWQSKKLNLQNHWPDVDQTELVGSSEVLDAKLYKLGHFDLFSQDGSHDSSKHIFVIFSANTLQI